VSKTYGKNVHALRNLNLHIEKGEFVFVMGDSGSGKSTMIRLLLREIEPTEGTITVDGMELKKLRGRKVPYYRRKLGVVFQDFRLLKDMNVYDNVAFAQRVLSKPAAEIRRDVPKILTRVGLSAKYKAYPNELSGGEQQRVAIARALVNKPDILLCDEPTGNLDSKNAWEVMELLEEINKEGTTVVMVTHSQEIVDRMQKRVIYMNYGELVGENIPHEEETGSSEVIDWEDETEEEEQ
jgi:cell division transport system ATP-binding protein